MVTESNCVVLLTFVFASLLFESPPIFIGASREGGLCGHYV
jgi:hypothetical protein